MRARAASAGARGRHANDGGHSAAAPAAAAGAGDGPPRSSRLLRCCQPGALTVAAQQHEAGVARHRP
jgi:hypothetical protein